MKKFDVKSKLMLILGALTLVVLIQACGHTNNLKKYDLRNQQILFDYEVVNDVELNVRLFDEPIKTGSKTADVVIDVAKSIGTAIVTGNLESKLRKAADPAVISNNLTNELEKTMIKYLSINPVNSIQSNYAFINTTTIRSIELNSNQYGLTLSVNAKVKLTERGTAKEVWDYCFKRTVPVNRLSDKMDKTAYGSSVSDIIQLTELATLSEETIKQAIIRASQEIGRVVSQKFQKDLSKASR